MGLLEKIGSSVMADASKNIGDIFTALANGISQFVSTPADKIKVQQLIQDAQQKQLEETNRHSEVLITEANKLVLSDDDNATKRQASDMMSDSWLSKNIRPMTLIYLLLLFTIMIFADRGVGGYFHIEDGYKEIIKGLLYSIFSFYFVGRLVEKCTSMIQSNKQDK